MASETEGATAVTSSAAVTPSKDNTGKLKLLIAILGASTVGLLVGVIVLATKDNSSTDKAGGSTEEMTALQKEHETLKADYDTLVAESKEPVVFKPEDNPCDGMRPNLPNEACLEAMEGQFSPGMELDPDIFTTGPQSGVNVTKGYNGARKVDYKPITEPYREKGLCPVNVHWHIGSEHYSMGEYDEKGTGPIDFHEGRQGFRCNYYDASDEKFTTPYQWEHCIGMAIGQTYEVHWPHSTQGACNEPWQYQSPFYDGVFCNLSFEDFLTLSPQDIAHNVGVQSQTFTVVNDEEYYYPDLFSGMILDEAAGKGVDLAIYTGSTTGTQRDNQVCSPFSPITWQVDRKCHLISASSFDRMCKQMEQQADNMKDDLYAHGSRELVIDIHAADNHQTLRRDLKEEEDKKNGHAGLRKKSL